MNPNEQNPRKVSIDLVKANLFAILIFAVSAVVFLVPFYLIWAHRVPFRELAGGGFSWLFFLIAMFVGIPIHELIHGITWAHYAERGWKSISFGVIWKYLTPYCHCDEPMKIRPYQLACMMPCFVLGVLPAVISLFICNLPLLIFGIFFISAAAGDIWMTWLLCKEDPQAMVLDHPSEAGFYIYE